jgi:apolipoprotein N-acyltransferase
MPGGPSLPRWTWIAVAFVCGLGLAASLPPVSVLPLVWLSLAGLAYSLGEGTLPSTAGRRARILEGSARGLAFGFAMNALSLRFVPGVVARFTSMPVVVGWVVLTTVGLLQAIPWAVLAMIRARLVLWRVPPWLAFAMGGFASTLVPCVFPWTPAGLLTPWPSAVQLADLVGERGVAFLVFVSAGLLADAARAFAERRLDRRTFVKASVAVGLPLLQAAHGAVRIQSVESLRARAPTATVALVSPAIDAAVRWKEGAEAPQLDRLRELAAEAEERGAELTVWSEAAYPYPLLHGTLQGPGGAHAILSSEARTPVLLGALTAPQGGGAEYNSALVAYPDGTVSDSYDKMHLLWFGETVPLGAWIPGLNGLFLPGGGLEEGVHPTVLEAGHVRAGALICYEDTLTAAAREAAAGGPNLLVNLTNDAWFSGSWEPDNQMRLSAMRAVETRRDLVRAVNGGPTSWIDATGAVRAVHVQAAPGVFLVQPALLDGPPTLYVRVGDLPLVVVLGALAWAARRRQRAARPSP